MNNKFINMEESRKKRYLDKLQLIKKRIKEIEEWKPEFFMDEKSKLAVYKAMQEVAEASLDLAAMLLKDEKVLVKDDYSNIENLKEIGIIDEKIASALKELNGLRNRVVHEYNGLDDTIALESMEDLIPEIEEFVEVVENWLKKK